MTIAAMFWIILRCVSYQIDAVNGGHRQTLTFLAYCLYLPTLFVGPFIPYEDFIKSHISNPHEKLPNRIGRLLVNLARFLFWYVVTEVCLHYVYVNAIAATYYQIEFLAGLDGWAFYGYGFTMGCFFHLKYVVCFGLSATIQQFEHIPAAPTPKCIARIHLYSDMWKHFDVGLHKFLLKYIYIPALQITRRRLLATSLCFGFVFVWHGLEQYILVWAVLNFLGVTMENVSAYLNEHYVKKSAFYKRIRPECVRRVSCLLASPLLALSAISNFYFFAQLDVGNLFMARFLTGDLQTNSVLLSVLYCCCQVSTELKRRHAMENMKKFKTN